MKKRRKRSSDHETGHALVAAFRSTAEKVHKISIVPRGIGALGFTLQLPTEDRYLMSRNELLEKIESSSAVEEPKSRFFMMSLPELRNDLQKATDIARSMVTVYGMTENLGAVTYQRQPGPQLQPQPNLYPVKEVSEETARMIDEEVRHIIEARMEEVLKTLKEHDDLLHLVAKRLLDVETIEAEEFLELVGMKPTEEVVAAEARV